MADFRDQHIKEALDKAVGAWHPEADARSRRRRIAIVVALTVVVGVAFWTMLYYSSPKHAAKPAPATKPVPIQLVPVAPKR